MKITKPPSQQPLLIPTSIWATTRSSRPGYFYNARFRGSQKFIVSWHSCTSIHVVRQCLERPQKTAGARAHVILRGYRRGGPRGLFFRHHVCWINNHASQPATGSDSCSGQGGDIKLDDLVLRHRIEPNCFTIQGRSRRSRGYEKLHYGSVTSIDDSKIWSKITAILDALPTCPGEYSSGWVWHVCRHARHFLNIPCCLQICGA